MKTNLRLQTSVRRFCPLIVITAIALVSRPAAQQSVTAAESSPAPPSNVLDLSGPWTARLDPEDRGRREFWYPLEDGVGQAVRLPGSTDSNGLGEPPAAPTRSAPKVTVTRWRSEARFVAPKVL
jgi:hypothetical protein